MTPPEVRLSDAALGAIREAARDAPKGEVLRLAIDASYQYDLCFGAIDPGDVVIVASGLDLAMDPRSARRANGVKIDFVEGPHGVGFKIENPNKGSPIKGVHPADLLRWLEKDERLQLIDVRPEAELARATVKAARRLDAAYRSELDALPKDAKLVFLAHHSSGAQATARSYYDRGFHDVWYVVGGIDGWATMDPEVPRY